ncbi:hypothetical protein G6F42_025844 [Rhizopus arrhizus]|nr:hypothetical protein G6F42_025844 [Rhizopus arrhizus]
MELCSRFIDPFLAGLFDDPDNSIYLRWLDETTLEAKAKEASSSRPDLSVTKSLGVKWATTLAYDEAKSAMYSDDHFIICKDLIKVASFCKDALDDQLFEGILAVQTIGRTVVFYLLTLPSQSIYTMIPLAIIKVPDSINDLPGLVYKVPDILKVLDASVFVQHTRRRSSIAVLQPCQWQISNSYFPSPRTARGPAISNFTTIDE